MTTHKRTPLYAAHVALGAKMAPFGGWDMPIQYAGILPEHHHTRAAASVFDICHMGEFELRGASAAADLDRLLTMSVATLAVGQCRYGYLLREDGGVLDDLTCYRLGAEKFWLVVNAATCSRDAEWIRAHISKNTVMENLSPRVAKLDIQGPISRAGMETAFGQSLPDLGYFRACEMTLGGHTVLLSRTGYTGEWGYELYFPVEAATKFWERLLDGETGLRPAGLGARDTLRLEMGYPLYGHELSETRTPVPVGRGAFIAWDKDFIGKAACERDRESPRELLVGLQLDGKRAARAGDRVYDAGAEVGVVTSGSIAPSLGVAVAMAFVCANAAVPDRTLTVDSRGTQLMARVTPPPFYRQGTARASR